MYDARTGAGFDGLHGVGRNFNRGAESTHEALTKLQQAERQESTSVANPYPPP